MTDTHATDISFVPITRPAYRHGIAHICAICREEFDDRDEFADHWNDQHY